MRSPRRDTTSICVWKSHTSVLPNAHTITLPAHDDPMNQRPDATASWMCLLVGVVCGLLAGGGTPAHAQSPPDGSTHTLVLRDVPLRQALDELVTATQINLIYDSELVGTERVFCAREDASPEALLQCILEGVPLDYVRTSSGTYVLVASARQTPRYGRLAGRVVDEETGEPLPHAHVLLADASTGTTTNEAGLFSFASLLAGPHRVVVTHLGYRTQEQQVWVRPDEGARTRIPLRPAPVRGDPIVVTGLHQRLPSQGLGQSELSSDPTATLGDAGTADVARGAAALMGVSRQSPLAELHLQGGSAGEHQVQLDGIPVRNPVSLGSLLGAFSPLALGRFTVHKAGFGAHQGSHLAGLVAVEHDVTRPGAQYATVEADPVSLNGRVQQPLRLPGGVRGDAMIAARTSVWDVYREPALHAMLTEWNTVDAFLTSHLLEREVRAAALEPHRSRIGVNFADLHAATRLHLDPYRTLYVSAYRGANEIGADFRSAPFGTGDYARTIATRDRYDWSNQGAQARLEWLVGARASGTLRLHGSRHTSRYEYLPRTDAGETDADAEAATSSGENMPDEDNAVREVGVEAALDYSLASRHRVDAALAAVHIDSRFRAGNGFMRPLAYERTAWQWTGHVQGEHTLRLPLTLEWGTRLTFIPNRTTVYAEPRAALRYDRASSAVGGYAVRVAGGLYRQFTNRFDLSSTGPTSVIPSIRFWLPVDRSLAPPRAYHAATEVLLMPAASWTIGAEAYYKWQPRILAVDYAALVDPDEEAVLQAGGQRDFVAASRGYAYGAGIQIQYDGQRLQGTLGYTFSRTRRTFPGRFDGRTMPAPWSEPHRLTADADVPIAGGLTAHLSWKGIWGRTWPFRRAYYDYLGLEAAPGTFGPHRLDDPSAQRLPPLYRLDTGLAYTNAWHGVRVTARAHLLNALDRANAFDRTLSPTDDGLAQSTRLLPGRRPALSVTVEY